MSQSGASNPGKGQEDGGVPSMYQSLKRAIHWNPANTQRAERATSSASNDKDPEPVARKKVLADFQLPDTQICERCKGSKGRHTFEELQVLQETCDRRKTDGSQCIIPVSIDQPKERSRALERALERVLPAAQLRGRSSRYILVRRDPKTESSSQAVYTQVRYDSVSRSPSPRVRSRSPSPVRRRRSRSYSPPVLNDGPRFRRHLRSRSRSRVRSFPPESDEGPSYRSIGRSLSRSPSPGRDYGKQTAQISGAQGTKSTAAGGSLPKLK